MLQLGFESDAVRHPSINGFTCPRLSVARPKVEDQRADAFMKNVPPFALLNVPSLQKRLREGPNALGLEVGHAL